MNGDLISIIVPVYNVEKYIDRCIQSILKQTYNNWELIIVNDGSKDNSAHICDSYAIMDTRITVIHQVNKGVGCARNTGIDNANGKYIVFVDSDDTIDMMYLEKLYDYIYESSYDFVSICANFIDENDDLIRRNNYKEDIVVVEKNDIFEVYMHTNYIEDVFWNKIFKKILFDELRFKESIIFEDSELIIRLLKKVNKVLFVKDFLYNYRIRSNSILNYTENNINKKIFNLKKMDLLKVYELSYYELLGTTYAQSYAMRILVTCSNYFNELIDSSIENKQKHINILKKYYKKYFKYFLFAKNLTYKEKILIVINFIKIILYH